MNLSRIAIFIGILMAGSSHVYAASEEVFSEDATSEVVASEDVATDEQMATENTQQPSADEQAMAENAQQAAAVKNKSYFYLGARAGWAAYENACSNNSLSCDSDTVGYGLYGGFQYNPWLALEVGLNNYGETEGQFVLGKNTTEVVGGELAVKLSYPVSKKVNLFSRLGAAYLSTDRSSLSDENDWSAMATAGISYQFSPKWSLRGEYQFIDSVTGTESNIHLTSLGMTYQF